MHEDKGKTRGGQNGPAAHGDPHECGGARSRPAQQAAHGGEPANTLASMQKRTCILNQLSGTAEHYFTKLRLCTKNPGIHLLCNKVVLGAPVLGNVAPAGTACHLRPPERCVGQKSRPTSTTE
jgi:hypothetical protein